MKELKIPLFQTRRSTPTCRVCTLNIAAVRAPPTQIESMHLPPIVNTATCKKRAGDLLCVLPTCSVQASAFREMCITPVERHRNVHLSMVYCSCGDYHLHVTLLSDVGQGDLLIPADFGAAKIFCQFDGSAHRY